MEKEAAKKGYELSFLLKEEGDATQLQQLLSQHGCEVSLASDIKRIALAYPIKKETSAFFGYVHINANPEDLTALVHQLELEPWCLRTLVVGEQYRRIIETPERIVSRGSRVDSRGEGEEEKTPSPSPSKQRGDAVTNEELEKKLEEILN